MIPPLLRKNQYDQIITLKEKDARQMTCKLAREEGIFSGTSTGANGWHLYSLPKNPEKEARLQQWRSTLV